MKDNPFPKKKKKKNRKKRKEKIHFGWKYDIFFKCSKNSLFKKHSTGI